MPALEQVVAKGNGLLKREQINELRSFVQQLMPIDLSTPIPDEIFQQFGIATPGEVEVLRRWPEGTKAVLRGALFSAIMRDPEPVPVTLAWMPAYDYEITVSEAKGTTGTTMTILLRGPYERVSAS